MSILSSGRILCEFSLCGPTIVLGLNYDRRMRNRCQHWTHRHTSLYLGHVILKLKTMPRSKDAQGKVAAMWKLMVGDKKP